MELYYTVPVWFQYYSNMTPYMTPYMTPHMIPPMLLIHLSPSTLCGTVLHCSCTVPTSFCTLYHTCFFIHLTFKLKWNCTIQFQYNSSTIPVWLQYNSSMTPVLFQYDSIHDSTHDSTYASITPFLLNHKGNCSCSLPNHEKWEKRMIWHMINE